MIFPKGVRSFPLATVSSSPIPESSRQSNEKGQDVLPAFSRTIV